MQGMFSKLSSYAALIGVIGAIGGGFMAWGEFNNRIAQLEDKEFIVNETVDLSGIIKEIEAVKGDVKINGAALEYLDAKIEEIKAEQKKDETVNSDGIQYRDDLKKRVTKLEELLSESSKEKDELRSLVLKLTEVK